MNNNCNQYPVLYAIPRSDKGFLSAWCPFCKKWHNHGKGEGHRVAHCGEGSPFKKTGYVLKVVKPPRV